MTFDELIEALGERLGMEIENAGGAAAVEVDGTVVVLQDAGELLLLRAEVGEMPEEGREALLASAMRANYLYSGTGGATLALDSDTSCLHLQKYNRLARLDAEGAFNMMESFASTVDAWRRIVADYRPPATESSGPDALDSGSLMQV